MLARDCCLLTAQASTYDAEAAVEIRLFPSAQAAGHRMSAPAKELSSTSLKPSGDPVSCGQLKFEIHQSIAKTVLWQKQMLWPPGAVSMSWRMALSANINNDYIKHQTHGQ